MRARPLRLGAGGEFDRLRAVFARLGAAATGLGDDCALVPIGRRTLAISIDLSLEGVHFRTDWLALREIGWRGRQPPYRIWRPRGRSRSACWFRWDCLEKAGDP